MGLEWPRKNAKKHVAPGIFVTFAFFSGQLYPVNFVLTQRWKPRMYIRGSDVNNCLKKSGTSAFVARWYYSEVKG
jgi:hypothetical protein